MIRNSIDVFIDDFFMFGNSFYEYLNNLERVLKIYVENNLP